MRFWVCAIVASGLLGCPRAQKPPTPGKLTCTGSTAAAAPFRLLTRAELDHTFVDLLGDTTSPAAATLPAEPLVFGFDNNALVNTANSAWVAASYALAEDVAARTVKERKAQLVTCTTEDAACAEQFVTTFGRKAFRRSLTVDEHDSLLAVFTTLQRDGFDAALEGTLTVLLQSPQFLYRPELGVRAALSGTAPTLSGVELATKLSYFLWGSTPDEALIAAAENGSLDTRDGLLAQARRLQASPHAVIAANDFFTRYFTLDALAGVNKDSTAFPMWDPQLQQSWRTSMELYFGEVARPGGTLAGLLQTPALYTNVTMTMYAPSSSEDFTRVAMSSPGRSGVLAQPGLLARLASPNQGSPVRRGVFVFDRLLCQPLPPPPANLKVTPPPLDPNATTRERFASHGTTPGCTACHHKIDPLGFGFEHFDGMGLWRDTEAGKPIDASGAIVEPNEDALAGPFDGVDGLTAKLVQSRQVHDCLATEWYRWALGRVEAESDACALGEVQQQFFDGGGSFEALQLAIIGSDAFRFRAGGTR